MSVMTKWEVGKLGKLATTGFKQTSSAQSPSRRAWNIVAPHKMCYAVTLYTYINTYIYVCAPCVLYHQISHTVHALTCTHACGVIFPGSVRQHEPQRASETPENFRDNFREAEELSRLVTSHFRKPARVCGTASLYVYVCIYIYISFYHLSYFAFAVCNVSDFNIAADASYSFGCNVFVVR